MLNMINIKHLVLLMLCILAVIPVGAQRVHVVSELGEDVAYANVMLISLHDSTIVASATTDNQGFFSLSQKGESKLQVKCIGYKDYEKNVNLDTLKVVKLEADSYALDEVVVKTSRKMMRSSGNAILTRVENTLLEKKGKLMDILPYMPFVSNVNNSIVVAGKGEPIFYLNDHRVFDPSELDQLLASDIKDVEVITSPGAEYESSVKAVIKIRTKRKQGEGLSGNIESTFTYLGGYVSEIPRSNFNYRTKGWDFFGSFNMRDTREKTTSERTLRLEGEKPFSQIQTADAFSHWLGYDGSLGMDFINTKWNVGMKYAFTKTPRLSDRTKSALKVETAENETYDLALDNRVKTDMLVQSINGYATYNLLDNTKISLEGYYSKSNNHTNQDISEIYASTESEQLFSKSSYNHHLAVGRLDVQHSLGAFLVKYGMEYSSTKYSMDYQDISDDQLAPYVNTERKESQLSAYGNLSFTGNAASASMGLRYEKCKMDRDDVSGNNTWTDERFYPYVSLRKSIGNVELGISYENKIKRPAYYLFRSNLMYNTPFEYTTGNANLKSTIFHIFNALVSYKEFSGSITYGIRKNAIVSMMRQYGNKQAVLTQPENVNTMKYLSISGDWYNNIGFWSPYVSIAWEKPFLEIDQVKFNKPTLSLQLYNTMTMRNGLSFDVNFSFSGSGNQNIQRREASNMVQVGTYKNFCSDKLYVGLYYMDVFKTNKDKYVIDLSNIQLSNDSYRAVDGLYLTLIYKFNKANSRYSGNKAGTSEKSRL